MTEFDYLIINKTELAKEAMVSGGIAKVNGEIRVCKSTSCLECDFAKNEDCRNAAKEWLDKEYILKPEFCPYCGSENVHVYTTTENKKYVLCDDCFARSGYCSTKEEAIFAWNRRV